MDKLKWTIILLIILIGGMIFNMGLDFGAGNLFDYSRETEQGFGGNKVEQVWSCPGTSFKSWRHGDQTREAYHYTIGTLESDSNGAFFFAPVLLPNTAIITSAVVYGSISDETWSLDKIDLSAGTSSIIISGNFNSEEKPASDETTLNEKFGYVFRTSSLDDTDQIWGAKITFVL